MEEEGLEDDLFATYRVRELDSEDFYTNSYLRVALKASGCSIVLFYMPRNPTSRAMKVIWNRLSEDLAGVNFFAVNVSRRAKIMQAFQQITEDENHPLHLYQLRGFPTILTYRDSDAAPGISTPQAFYNGELSYDALLNYAITLACVSGHREFPALREGVIVDDEIIVTDPRSTTTTKPASSLDFRSDIDMYELTDDAFLSEDLQYEDEYTGDEAAEYEAQRKVSAEAYNRYFSTESFETIDPGILDALEMEEL